MAISTQIAIIATQAIHRAVSIGTEPIMCTLIRFMVSIWRSSRFVGISARPTMPT